MKNLTKIIVTLAALFVTSDCFASYQVCFTPQENCTQEIVNTIGGAKKQILVQAYSFTSQPIANALGDAEVRGVDVEVLLDKSQRKAKRSEYNYLITMHIPVKIDYRPAIAHNKVMVIDDQTVITGSFNFTRQAQFKNAENLLIINDKNLAKKYHDNWYYRNSLSI